MSGGATAYLTKPIDVRLLVEPAAGDRHAEERRRRPAEAADGEGELERHVVVVDLHRLAVPRDCARAAVTHVEVRVLEQLALAVVLGVDTEPVERPALERGVRERRGRQLAR